MNKELQGRIEMFAKSDAVIRNTYSDSAYTAEVACIKGAHFGVQLGYELAIEELKEKVVTSMTGAKWAYFLKEWGTQQGILPSNTNDQCPHVSHPSSCLVCDTKEGV